MWKEDTAGGAAISTSFQELVPFGATLGAEKPKRKREI